MSRSMVSAKEAMMSTPFYDYSTRSGAMDGYTGTACTSHTTLADRVHVKCNLQM